MIKLAAQTFMDQMYLEKEVEKQKINLARNLKFTCLSAFEAFDSFGLETMSE